MIHKQVEFQRAISLSCHHNWESYIISHSFDVNLGCIASPISSFFPFSLNKDGYARSNMSTVYVFRTLSNSCAVGEIRYDFFRRTFSSNALTYLSASALSSLAGFVTLFFKDNIITYIEPRAFQSLGSLRNLDLSYNMLTVILPDTFYNLTRLRNLFESTKMTKIWLRMLIVLSS